jgi:hypothetical protein
LAPTPTSVAEPGWSEKPGADGAGVEALTGPNAPPDVFSGRPGSTASLEVFTDGLCQSALLAGFSNGLCLTAPAADAADPPGTVTPNMPTMVQTAIEVSLRTR